MAGKKKALNAHEHNDNGTTTIIIDSPKHGICKAFIDSEDYDLVKDYRWCVSWDRGRRDGAQLRVVSNQRNGAKNIQIRLHTLLMSDKLQGYPGLVVDHIDGQPLNNTKANLRVVSASENQWNRRNAKGYTYVSATGKYQSAIQVGSKWCYLGLYSTLEEAKQVYFEAKMIFHPIIKR